MFECVSALHAADVTFLIAALVSSCRAEGFKVFTFGEGERSRSQLHSKQTLVHLSATR